MNPEKNSKPHKRTLLIALLSLLPAAISHTSYALDSDREQAIEISADRAELDEKNTSASYVGNVVLIQGTLKIIADSLSIQASSDGKVETVTAIGSLAEFSQQPDPKSAVLTARAKKIDYLVADEKIVLTGDASAVQQDNLFKGDIIQYDIKRQKLQAEGKTSTNGSNGEKTEGRVKMILQPRIKAATPQPKKVNSPETNPPAATQTTSENPTASPSASKQESGLND